ncbi:amino acid ABC transporter permease [Thalassospira xiamenensis]|nr:amino acid ABC transporter permease [Thalassospira xiamenensis]
MAAQPGIWIGMDNMIGDVIVAVVLGFMIWLNFRLLHNLPFRVQTTIIWTELLLGFALFFYSFDLSFDFIGSRLPFLLGLRLEGEFLQGAVLTLFISLVSIFCATVLALAAALGRLSKNGVLYGISTFYTSFFRGTPLLLQVMLIYLGLPQVGIVLSAVPAGIIALSLCYGAYMAEIFRAGIEGVPEGQTEAALSLGLKPYQVMRLVILPQALRLVIPPTGNQFISMLKDSSLVSVMGVWELMYLARTHGRSEFKYMEMLISAALIYWALSGIFEFIQSRIEKKLGKGVRV